MSLGLVATIHGTAGATDYYLDSVTGKDSHPGTAPAGLETALLAGRAQYRRRCSRLRE
jgi:hypothetical protein